MRDIRQFVESSIPISTVLSLVTERGGQAPGTMELISTSVDQAIDFARILEQKYRNFDFDRDMANFERNFKLAQQKAGTGRTQRRDMPVINTGDVREFQGRLQSGSIDLNAPFAPATNVRNPFPEGLQGEQAKEFLEKGLHIYDGDERDDMVSVKQTKVAVKDLHPIQRQIYFDKSMDSIARYGAEGTRKHISAASLFIISSDNFIIDGHHRFLAGILVDPNIKANCVAVNLPISTLLPMSLAYGDAIGNKRNM